MVVEEVETVVVRVDVIVGIYVVVGVVLSKRAKFLVSYEWCHRCQSSYTGNKT